MDANVFEVYLDVLGFYAKTTEQILMKFDTEDCCWLTSHFLFKAVLCFKSVINIHTGLEGAGAIS